ncbi:circumsporozoite protein-like [Penaeus chinensis]|uniref:circumsporozoite protein-like n=1 Tax=Penaeus chinensis TaxID=139456 RepID=UPI001FB7C86D|nr:circumsporozoite protein-like [Penaeus chinensis]
MHTKYKGEGRRISWEYQLTLAGFPTVVGTTRLRRGAKGTSEGGGDPKKIPDKNCNQRATWAQDETINKRPFATASVRVSEGIYSGVNVASRGRKNNCVNKRLRRTPQPPSPQPLHSSWPSSVSAPVAAVEALGAMSGGDEVVVRTRLRTGCDRSDDEDKAAGGDRSDGEDEATGCDRSDGEDKAAGGDRSDGEDKVAGGDRSDGEDEATGCDRSDGEDKVAGGDRSDGEDKVAGGDRSDGEDKAVRNDRSDGNSKTARGDGESKGKGIAPLTQEVRLAVGPVERVTVDEQDENESYLSRLCSGRYQPSVRPVGQGNSTISRKYP